MQTEEKTCWKELQEFTKQTKKNGVITITFAKEQGKEQQEPLRARCVERNKNQDQEKKANRKNVWCC